MLLFTIPSPSCVEMAAAAAGAPVEGKGKKPVPMVIRDVPGHLVKHGGFDTRAKLRAVELQMKADEKKRGGGGGGGGSGECNACGSKHVMRGFVMGNGGEFYVSLYDIDHALGISKGSMLSVRSIVKEGDILTLRGRYPDRNRATQDLLCAPVTLLGGRLGEFKGLQHAKPRTQMINALIPLLQWLVDWSKEAAAPLAVIDHPFTAQMAHQLSFPDYVRLVSVILLSQQQQQQPPPPPPLLLPPPPVPAAAAAVIVPTPIRPSPVLAATPMQIVQPSPSVAR